MSSGQDAAGLRVLHVSMPTTAGVPVVVLSYLRDQLARGWRVGLACPSDGWLADEARALGVYVVPWEASRAPGAGTPRETRRLAALVRDFAPDLVHLHSAKAGLAGRLAVRGRVPTVFQPHAWSFSAVHGPVRTATLQWERFAARWSDVLVLVSRAEQEEGRAAGIGGRAVVVPNGVDTNALVPATAADRSAARASLGLAAGPLAVCVGRLCEQKGQHDLLDSWPAVRRVVPGASLVLIGDGPDRDALQARAVDGVRLAGERRDVADWLAAADLVVAPSRWEGMALAPLEAMARARYVVATDVAGMAEAMPAGTGTVVPVGAVDVLAGAIAERLADPAGTDAAGLVARAHVAAHHDVAQAAAALVAVYGSVRGSAGRNRPVR